MQTKFLTLLFSLLVIAISAQTNLIGKVTDEETGEAILFGSMALYKADTLIAGKETDIDGKYSFQDLQPGIYRVEVSYTSYKTTRVENVEIKATTVLDIQMKGDGVSLYQYSIDYRIPLIEIDNTTSGHIFDSSWIRRSATRGF